MARTLSSSTVRSSPTLVAALILAGALVAGCGGRGNDAGDGGGSGRSMNTPAFDADPQAVATFVNGGWQIVLVPEAGQVEVDPPTLDATFATDTLYETTGQAMAADLTGAVGATGMTGGLFTVTQDGSALPMIEFTTPSLTITSLTGETMTIEGPIGWTGQLSEGVFIGTATGPNGEVSAWEGRRSN